MKKVLLLLSLIFLSTQSHAQCWQSITSGDAHTVAVANLFPSPTFNSNRFFGFHNANYQDIPGYYDINTAPHGDGYDDNLDDYQVLTTTERNGLMTPGLGYATWPPTLATGLGVGLFNYNILFDGQPNNGVVTVPVYHNTPSNYFPNLVGNPYPCAINLDTFLDVNSNLIDPVVYIWGRMGIYNDDTPYGANSGPDALNYSQDNYVIYNPTLMSLPANLGNNHFPVNRLASCQSFFVNTSSAAGNLIFNNSMRTIGLNNTFLRPVNSASENKLWLKIAGNKLETQIGIAFLENCSDNYIRKEDVKAMSGRALNFYTQTTAEDLIIDGRNINYQNTAIPLGITNLSESKTLTISIEKVTGGLKDNAIYLYDALLNKTVDLNKSSYVFESENKIIEQRFYLKFKNVNVIASHFKQDDVQFVFKNNLLTVNSSQNKIKSVSVFDIFTPAINSQLIKQENVNANTFECNVDPKIKIILIKAELENGTSITKKMIQ